MSINLFMILIQIIHDVSGKTLYITPGTTLEQEDTFFKAPNGRLKVSIHRSIDG